ncbi:NADH-ubiquinone oxidoreductase-F iron-sulfur binding region domain-containing protein [Vulcanisaeta thermophila]|uniref:NADH-ubiquinone oxidoreductase-F iron-sulfur binding region domain-containing protein n=1 Tax=Vulcanisaeta thermophila TaxID=867917 RepID=UPI000852FADD|nr:NADH-ubiquinone oxidoreductase-F iron-sulfur binding region domain-containing protein [Vulcanisaeta thermophila]
MDYRARLRKATSEVLENRVIDYDKLREIASKYNVPPSTLMTFSSFAFHDYSENQVCMGLPCILRGAKDVVRELEKRGIKYSVTYCLGYCDEGPVVRMGNKYYTFVNGDFREIEKSRYEYVLSHRETLSNYVGRGGYKYLERFLNENDKLFLLELLVKVGLMGPGALGRFKSMASSPVKPKYLVINGHEGEPGGFKDRLIMERNAHQLLEGSLLLGVALGIDEVVVAINERFRNARAIIEEALGELRDYLRGKGLIDKLPTISTSLVSSPYVVGEETALIDNLEGGRGEPRVRPPDPTEAGLYGKPTAVINVEVAAAAPLLLAMHYEGKEPIIEKYFCVTGDVEKPGLYREPLTTALSDLLMKAGAKDVKAVFVGGVSSGLIHSARITVKLTPEETRKLGVFIGPGVIIPLSSSRCIVDTMLEVERFFAHESCGRCEPCRLGTKELVGVLEKIKSGRATMDDLKWAEDVARTMMETSLCGLGQSAGKVFLDALSQFRDEFEEHLRGVCRAHVCFG